VNYKKGLAFANISLELKVMPVPNVCKAQF